MSKPRIHELHLIFFFNDDEKLEVELGLDQTEVERRFSSNHRGRTAINIKAIDLSEVMSIGVGLFLISIGRDQLLNRARGRLNQLLSMVQPIIENHRK